MERIFRDGDVVRPRDAYLKKVIRYAIVDETDIKEAMRKVEANNAVSAKEAK